MLCCLFHYVSLNEYNFLNVYSNIGQTFSLLKILQGHENTVNNIRFSLDNRKIVSSLDDKTVQIWDIASEEPIQTFRGHLNWSYSAQFSPNNDIAVSCLRDETI
ncbi:hypothetical protein RFI_24178 [Reticulomyxa filosa]|uniref:Uncharacterized protein n=1 Tax=Reticulomyxa filosa TaxID=46433 RepID=X6MHP5_RETFI|nr:hypothetical protein RFI_24178 [Reticulomyxa filosa]|eukprot:ETO13196.1 hypothetical protein RFI_24178 [Reticulomyxa filosa]